MAYMNVFIVEDQPWFLEQLQALLADVSGANIVGTADTAHDAIHAIGETRPDVVLLDLMLKEGTGFDVLRSVRTRAPAIKLLVVTSFPTPGIKKACSLGGANGFFDKLLELDELRSMLESLANSIQYPADC
jgi:DNA-binding NarL/FixJ family response regulator